MPTNLTGFQINSTYRQILHISDGPTATEKVVYSGTGVATALRLGTTTMSGTFSSISFVNPAAARVSMGLGTMSTQNANSVAVTGGVINGATVGATTPATVKGTTVEATTSIGYPVGTGGAVSQATSKSTGVALNKITGRITMNNAALNRSSGVSFTLTNSLIAATDVVVVSIASGANLTAYVAGVAAVGAGSCSIHLRNLLSDTDLSEVVVLNFAVIKGAIA